MYGEPHAVSLHREALAGVNSWKLGTNKNSQYLSLFHYNGSNLSFKKQFDTRENNPSDRPPLPNCDDNAFQSVTQADSWKQGRSYLRNLVFLSTSLG